MSGVTDNTAFSDFEGNPSNTASSSPHSSELPVEMYLERLSNSLDGFSGTMSINPDVWEKGTIDSKDSWEKLSDWFTAIEFKDQPEDVNIPYWGRVDIPTLEELGDLEKTDFTTKDVISRLFFVSSVLNIDIEYQDKQNGYSEKSMKFEDLITEVYPGLETSMRDIQEQLKLAITDPKKFERLFGPKDNKGRTLRELFLSRSKEITATSTVALMFLLSSCNSPSAQADPIPIIETIEQEASPTPTPSLTPTQTQTATPTQTSTKTPTPTNTPTRIPTSEDYWVRGYSVGIEISPGEGASNTLFVEEAVIDDYYLEEDEIVLDIDMLIYERQIKESIRAKSFRFMEYSFETRSFSSPIIITAGNFSELEELLSDIGQKTLFQVEVTVVDRPEFSDDFVVDYVSGYVDPDFNIVQIVKYEDTKR